MRVKERGWADEETLQLPLWTSNMGAYRMESIGVVGIDVVVEEVK